MNIKKLKILSFFGIFIANFIAHFGYEILESNFTLIFFPVNESIWEHMKMLFTAYYLYALIEYSIIYLTKTKVYNYIFNLWATGISTIIIYLIIFLPLNNIYKNNEIIIFGTLIITLVLTQFISYYILTHNHKISNKIGIFLTIITYIGFGYLTYHPLKIPLFLDENENKYGLNEYVI